MNKPNQSKVIADGVNSIFDESADYIRESKLDLGISNMRSRIRNVKVQTESNCNTKKPKAKKRYKGSELAEVAIDVYRSNINPKEEKEEKEGYVKVPNTMASRAHIKAMARALTGMRNGGDVGKYSPDAGPNGGNTGMPTAGNYVALTTSMSMEEYEEYINGKFISEEVEEVEEVVEETPELLVEDPVGDLEEGLMKLEDTSWQSIDKLMRRIASEYDITPKQLHKDFKAEHKMIPDEWVKKNQVSEQVGWFPLEEAVRMNKIGQVYEVSFLFRGGTQRLKFFWPEVGVPSRDQMEEACRKFWPGARLLAFYPSMSAGDNQDNFMVLVPAMTENFHIVDDKAWVEMTEEESLAYQMICEEEGEPVSPPMIQDDGTTLLLIEDHDTGEVQEVVIEGNKSGDSSLHDWFNKSKSSDGKKGWVQIGGPYAGKPCAKQPGQKSKPKCGSSKMKRNLDKKEEDRAFNRKNREDPNPNRSGKAKNVATEEVILEKEGKKDACYNKVKSRYKVWPSAYASGALVKCRKKGASNWGNSSKKEEFEYQSEGFKKLGKRQIDGMIDAENRNDAKGNTYAADVSSYKRAQQREDPIRYKHDSKEIELHNRRKGKEKKQQKEEFETMDEACWKGYTKKGMKTMFGKRYPNCVKKEETEIQEDMSGMSQKSGDKRSTESGAGMTAQGVAKYNRRTGGNLKTAVTTPPSKLKPGSKAANRRKSFCARSRGWTGERGKAARRRWNC